MAIGRTFKEAFLKAVRSLELGKFGRLFPESPDEAAERDEDDTALRKRLVVPSDRRMWAIFRALRRGWTVETLHELTKNRSVVPAAVRRHHGAAPRMAALGEFREMSTDLLRNAQAQRVQRRGHRRGVRRGRRRRPPAPAR